MVKKQKLTEEQKAEIRTAHDAGASYPELAARYEVSAATILRVCRPDTYERQKAANRKYQSNNVKKITDARKGVYKNYRLTLHTKKDSAIITRLDSQPNVTGYVRELVSNDMKSDVSKDGDAGSKD